MTISVIDVDGYNIYLVDEETQVRDIRNTVKAVYNRHCWVIKNMLDVKDVFILDSYPYNDEVSAVARLL